MYELDLYKQWFLIFSILSCIISLFVLGIYIIINHVKGNNRNLKMEFILILLSIVLSSIFVFIFKSYQITTNKEYEISIVKCDNLNNTCNIILNGNTIVMVDVADDNSDDNDYLSFKTYYKNKLKENKNQENIDYGFLYLTSDSKSEFMK